jgi:hypothetical protein
MPLINRKTPEQKVREAAEKAERQRLGQIEKLRQAFFRTPAGLARLAFEKGDQVFQSAFDVMSQQAIIVPMVGGTTSKTTSDPTDILNSVCHEGWELVSGSFVFVQHGQESRDKFMASGQNVAVRGWVNAIQVWAPGTVDMSKGEIHVRGYAA